MSVLAPEWRAWIAENLLRGAEPARIRAHLKEKGVDEATVDAELTRIDRLPELAGARGVARSMKSRETILRLERELSRKLVIESRTGIDAAVFFGTYFAGSLPVVMPDFAADWPAIGKWDLDFFARELGDEEIAITDGREADPHYDMNSAKHARATTFAALCARIRDAGPTNDFYAVAQNRNLARPALQRLFDDIGFDRGILDRGRTPSSSALWLGPEGTVTPLHHDTSAILFVQVWGRKRVKLVAPCETALLDGARAMYASVDPEQPWDDDPRLRAVKVHTIELGPGETLFLPACWWHHVRALSPSISLAFNGLVGQGNSFPWYLPAQP